MATGASNRDSPTESIKRGFMGFSACRKCNKLSLDSTPSAHGKAIVLLLISVSHSLSVTVTAAVSNSSSISFSLSLSLIHSRPTHSGLPFNVHHHGRCSQTAAIFFFFFVFALPHLRSGNPSSYYQLVLICSVCQPRFYQSTPKYGTHPVIYIYCLL